MRRHVWSLAHLHKQLKELRESNQKLRTKNLQLRKDLVRMYSEAISFEAMYQIEQWADHWARHPIVIMGDPSI